MTSHVTKVDASALVAQLADEMIAEWRSGRATLTESYLERHPELWDHPDAALELIAEELALREEHGRTTTPSELVRRFPRWRPQVETLWQCQNTFRTSPQVQRPPRAGDVLSGFRLVTELGRGAHGRVFLATQSALGGRAVVLKLAPRTGGEHLSLARLQHSHIVPLFSAHEFPEHGLRGLCLPYFGRATLATLLESLSRLPAVARSGERLLAALQAAENESPFPLPVTGPVCDRLRTESPVAVACGLVADLADALGYAHERGLVHLDVKPSNVLVAADGVAMLLDFHLARPPLAAGAPAPAWLGGTPEYMAPELATALDAVRAGAPIPAAVDGRADIFSLGIVLRELLGTSGCRDGAPVSCGLLDIIDRCTAPDPATRYPTAALLADDLRRHRADLPLKGVPNRSLVERWCKWRRRRPLAGPALVCAAALLAGGAGLATHFYRQSERAEAALRAGEAHLAHGRYAEGLEALRGSEALARGVPLTAPLARRLADARRMAERAQTAEELHAICDQVRPLYAAEALAPADVRAAETRCRAFWAKREEIVARLDGQPTTDLERQWRADLLDLGILTAHFHTRLVPPGNVRDTHRQALATLDEAEALLGPSGALCLERAAHATALGQSDLADESERRAAELLPRTAWDHLVIARARLAAHDECGAAAQFERCLALDPASVWGNHYHGVCLLRQGDAAGAAAAFSACIALAPRAPWFFYNRALAEAESGRVDRARADFDSALALDPRFAAALLGRALVHQRAGRPAAALADLRAALAAGSPPATVHYHTALVELAGGNPTAAVTALRECLACDPAHTEARAALARLTAER